MGKGFISTVLIWIIFVVVPYFIWGIKVAFIPFMLILSASFLFNAYYGLVKKKLKDTLSDKLGFYVQETSIYYLRARRLKMKYKETPEIAHKIGRNNLIIGTVLLIVLISIYVLLLLGY